MTVLKNWFKSPESKVGEMKYPCKDCKKCEKRYHGLTSNFQCFRPLEQERIGKYEFSLSYNMAACGACKTREIIEREKELQLLNDHLMNLEQSGNDKEFDIHKVFEDQRLGFNEREK